ncbi:hypothetical protein PsorP6_012098 [Peronosclerospora sorghi]|uniref:Uncharacterized protein n=1 Tax=Peronosclerospora sorghi TaxID=230839 RepID=A0ACC0WJN1_9STRA|nr:hypothetical protein PsorP6_012098 [Peronosclerospora sorghi]
MHLRNSFRNTPASRGRNRTLRMLVVVNTIVLERFFRYACGNTRQVQVRVDCLHDAQYVPSKAALYIHLPTVLTTFIFVRAGTQRCMNLQRLDRKSHSNTLPSWWAETASVSSVGWKWRENAGESPDVTKRLHHRQRVSQIRIVLSSATPNKNVLEFGGKTSKLHLRHSNIFECGAVVHTYGREVTISSTELCLHEPRSFTELLLLSCPSQHLLYFQLIKSEKSSV